MSTQRKIEIGIMLGLYQQRTRMNVFDLAEEIEIDSAIIPKLISGDPTVSESDWTKLEDFVAKNTAVILGQAQGTNP